MATTYWTGGNGGDFYDVCNWNTKQSPFDFHDVNISGASADAVSTANACEAVSCSIPSLTVGNYGVLNITADADDCSSAPVFSTDSFQVFEYGSIVIDTSDVVQLGKFNNLSGTMTIKDNDGNVLFTPNNRLTGNGTLNLEDSTFGSQANSINIDNAMHVNLSGHSSVYTGFLATGTKVSFDPSATEKFFLNGNNTTVNTEFTGVSSKTQFGVTANTGSTPLSASYEKNSNGSYSLVVKETGNHTMTLNNITPASGFTPGDLAIKQDDKGNYLIVNAEKKPDGGGCHPHHPHHPHDPCKPHGGHHWNWGKGCDAFGWLKDCFKGLDKDISSCIKGFKDSFAGAHCGSWKVALPSCGKGGFDFNHGCFPKGGFSRDCFGGFGHHGGPVAPQPHGHKWGPFC